MRLSAKCQWRALAVCLALLGWAAGGAALGQTLPAAGQPAPPPQWTGPFVGIGALGGWSNSATGEFLAANGATFHRFETTGAGPGGAFDFGYDWRAPASNLVFGFTGQLGWLGDPGGHVFRTSTDLFSTMEARAGIVPAPGLLVYGQTGIALDNQAVRIELGGPVTRLHEVAPGVALGLGGEYALGIAPPMLPARFISLFAEYQHIWWAAQSIAAPAASPGLDFQWQRQSNIIQAGARLRF